MNWNENLAEISGLLFLEISLSIMHHPFDASFFFEIPKILACTRLSFFGFRLCRNFSNG